MPFASAQESQQEIVERTFAAVSDLYAECWNEFFHFALFAPDGASWDQAFERTHEQYAKALRIDRARKVLELACGRGAFAAFLAERTDGEVLAIDISERQLSRARRHRRHNLRFLRHDVMRVHELADTFDAVVCLDAACYLPDKRAAVERIGQVVAPGGRLLLVDWCRDEGVSSLQEELVLRPLMEAWAVPSFETASRYRRHLERARLRLLESRDLNDAVAPNWELGYQRALDAVRDLGGAGTLAWKRLRTRSSDIPIVKDQFRAALYIKAAFDAGFLRYTYLLAEKA